MLFSGLNNNPNAGFRIYGYNAENANGTGRLDNVIFTGCQVAADLAVTKTDGVASVNAGGTTTYTLTLTNNGPSAANNATISDAAVAGLTKTAIGACTPAGGAVCPTVGAGAGQMNIANLEAGTVVVPTLPSSGSISFSVTVNVTATSGSVANTFTATPPVGTTDPTPATVTDTDTVNPIADLVVTKTDGVASVKCRRHDDIYPDPDQ